MELSDDRSAARTAEDLTGAKVGRYVINARLGAGAMGEVYLAQHTQLQHNVAIKRLAPKLRADARYLARFLREGQRASALNHPHIARVYDVLEEKGELLLVMEYVEGTTLRERLKEAMGMEEFLETGIQCGEALAAAHEKGILHGDIKPENIMLTPEHQVKVLDFGVARRLPIFDENAETQSLEGTISGTPAYMAPEVLLLRQADARADIFSLGVVFYEALSGRHPFLAEGFTATTDRILHEVPPPLSRIDPDVPEALSGIVAKALAKDPAVRYASAQQVVDDLRAVQRGEQSGPQPRSHLGLSLRRRVVLGVVAVAVLALIVWYLMRPRIPAEPRLAVLAFTSLDNTPESQVIGKGIRETLNARVAQLAPSLDVVPTTVVSRNPDGSWAETPVDTGAAARQSRANLALRGTVYINGSRVIVQYVLTNIEVGKELSGDVVEGDRGDLYSLEDRVAQSVISHLGVAVNSQVLRAAEASAPRVEGAFEPYVKGRGYLENYDRPENVESAIDAFKHAVALDSKFAPAYAGLGKAYWRKYESSRDTQWLEAARQACGEAVALDAKLAEAHICLGRLDNVAGQYQKAVEEYQRALDEQPASDDAYIGLAAAYEGLNRAADAEKTYRRAINLRPDYWAGYNWLGAFYYGQGRYADAAEAFTQMVARAPDSFVGYSNLGLAQLYLGRYREAISSFQRSVSMRPSGVAYSNLATAYFYQKQYAEAARTYREGLKIAERDYLLWGNLGDALYWGPASRSQAPDAYRKAILLANEQLQVNPHDARVLGFRAWYHAALGESVAALSDAQRALQLAPRDPELMVNAALVYNQLKETQRALVWLTKAVGAGYRPIILRDTPNFDNLRGDRAFQALLKE